MGGMRGVSLAASIPPHSTTATQKPQVGEERGRGKHQLDPEGG
jgi:hypothetical protein